jgi:hypothetical protein
LCQLGELFVGRFFLVQRLLEQFHCLLVTE